MRAGKNAIVATLYGRIGDLEREITLCRRLIAMNETGGKPQTRSGQPRSRSGPYSQARVLSVLTDEWLSPDDVAHSTGATTASSVRQTLLRLVERGEAEMRDSPVMSFRRKQASRYFSRDQLALVRQGVAP